MADHINRSIIAADIFAELTEQGQAESIYESDYFTSHVLPLVVEAYLGKPGSLANLGTAVLACVDDVLREQIDAEVASFSPRDYPAEHDAAHASHLIDRDNARDITRRSSLDLFI